MHHDRAAPQRGHRHAERFVGRNDHRRATTTRSRPARSACTSAVANPLSRTNSLTDAPCVAPISSTSAPVTASHSRASPDDRFVRLEAARPGDERLDGLPVTHLGGKLVVGRDVGRVRHDHVDDTPQRLRAADRTSLPCDQRDVARHSTEAGAVGLRDRERVGRDIGRPHLRASALDGDRQRDRARAGAEVDDHARRARRGPAPTIVFGQRVLGDDLGFGPRDQHPAIEIQVEHAGTTNCRRRTAAAPR